MARHLFFLPIFFLGFFNGLTAQTSLYYNAENHRSDTFDVLKYTINLEVGNSVNKLLTGNTQIRFAPKLNNRSYIRLDLLKFTIDSVKENNSLLSFFYNDTILKVNFSSPKNITDTSVITVFYHGQPQIDATGWGGFYFDNTQSAEYAYNLGVGFGAKPHNYGRTWFPCFDNFVERSKYEFNITTDSSRRAFCNGQLISNVVAGNKRTVRWQLNEQIPTYLASVSLAGNYARVNWQVNTLSGTKPIWLVANASDTAAMKSGFVNLVNCIHGFENYFGPYRWNRFGYCAVPFGSGAMEHATNITYPKPFLGSLAYEADLMAHELSHHWWGDLITCETPEDMWINEGMATFSAYMFVEWQYGKPAYLTKVKTQHDNLLHTLHKKEGFRAISGVPHSLTYGDHVYLKGADVAHTLRGYLGDTAFFAACKYTMQQSAFHHLNSNDLKLYFQTAGQMNLGSFFNDWVYSGGWPHFSIDSVRYTSAVFPNTNAVVYIRQQVFGAPHLYSNVPLELSFFTANRARVVKRVVVSGALSSVTVTIPFSPVYCGLNYDAKISDATSTDARRLKTLGATNFTLGKMICTVQNTGSDTSLVRVVHHYVKPDPIQHNPFGHHLSDQHFWTVEGILSQGFQAKAKFYFDGFKNLTTTNGYMDTLLTRFNTDSLALFYRKSVMDDWQVVIHATKGITGAKAGYVEADTLKLGEYTFGNIADTLTAGLNSKQQSMSVKIYPNPGKQVITVDLPHKPEKQTYAYVYDISGKLIFKQELTQAKTNMDVTALPRGTFIISVYRDKSHVSSQKIVLE